MVRIVGVLNPQPGGTHALGIVGFSFDTVAGDVRQATFWEPGRPDLRRLCYESFQQPEIRQFAVPESVFAAVVERVGGARDHVGQLRRLLLDIEFDSATQEHLEHVLERNLQAAVSSGTVRREDFEVHGRGAPSDTAATVISGAHQDLQSEIIPIIENALGRIPPIVGLDFCPLHNQPYICSGCVS